MVLDRKKTNMDESTTEKIRLTELKKNQDPSFHAAIDLQLEKINETLKL